VGESSTPAGVFRSYWDRESTGQSSSPGGGVSLTSIQMQDPASFGWSGSAWTWTNAPRPFLRSLQSSRTNIATLPTVDAKYSGVSYAYTGNPPIKYTLSSFTPDYTPSFTYSDLPLNVGTYTFTTCCLSTQRQVVTSILLGTITISPADLTLSGGRVDDGTTTVTPAAGAVAFNADQPLFNPATGSVTGASLFWDQFRGVIGRNSGKLVVLLSDLSFGFEGATQSRGETLTGPGTVNSGGQTVSYSVTNLSNGRAASASREQGSSGIAQRLNLVVDSSEQQTFSSEQVQALLGQAMKSIRQGGAP
jgi:hypothetical protein